MSTAAPERGYVVGARYRLESVLGEGGMAVVWRAVHTETDRKVALKLVRPELVRSEVIREMFVREARVAARIGKSDHIVDVLDAGVDDTLKAPFIAMELLEGESVEARIRKGPLPWPLVADLLEQLADGLGQAHAAGVFHRDLKPQNLFLTQDRKGAPLLNGLDFGIAKLSESVQSSATQVGTPAYSAPEQLGESWRNLAKGRGKTIAPTVSAGTDVWALGLIAFEMLTGKEPGAYWGATTLAELPVKIVLEPLPPSHTRADPALLPRGFDPWVARCLEIDASARWPTPRDAVNALTPMLRRMGSIPDAAPPQHVRPSIPHASPRAMTGPPPGTAPPGQWQAAPMHAAFTGPIDPRVSAWVARWRAELRTPGDPRTFAPWPVMFLPRVEQVPRDARLALPGGVIVTVADVITSDALRKAMGEERMIYALAQTPRLAYRAALRSKRSGGLVDGMARGLKALESLGGLPQGGVLGDPAFEQHYEVWAPSPHEARAAFPVPLRQLLISIGFHGSVERFPGAMMVAMFGATRFDPPELDRLLDITQRLLALAP